MTRSIHAPIALLPEGWAEDVLVCLGEDGRIASVDVGTEALAESDRQSILLPAPANLHSHAFQRAMAGLTEARGDEPTDSFWTWRRLMYRFLEHLTPEDVEAIAAFVQMEMLEAGYGASVEFHYLHHQAGGAPYDNLAEMSARIAAAAAQSGIGLTLLPVLYEFGGIDRRPLGPGQARFGNDFDRFARLVEGAEAALAELPADAVLGLSAHSLRAVSAGSLARVAALGPTRPLHIHIAEQQAEVDEIVDTTGARPVEWLLANAEVTDRWCLIHATHMNLEETAGVARSGAVAGLCPITESNLGDGIFDGVRFVEAGGVFGVGSDSNVRISLTEELRTLEYSQRLARNRRAALATADRSAGRVLFETAARGGAMAASRTSGSIAAGHITAGNWADLIGLDGDSIHLVNRSGDQILDSFIFAGDDGMVREVWSAGRHVVTGGRHRDHDRLTAAYARTVARLATE